MVATSITTDTSLQETGFENEVLRELKSRITNRFMQYDCFTFDGSHVSVMLHLTGNSMSISIPFILKGTSKQCILLYRNATFVGSIQSCISIMMSNLNRERSKLSKFKNHV
jgi:hypothetical protein